MNRYVIDASVAIKWFVPRAEEDNLEQAMAILDLLSQGKIVCYQPSHFITEVIAVLSRLCPEKASDDLIDLLNMDFHTVESTKIYVTACELSIQLNHHTFDTLYHAVALKTLDTTLITADEAYYRKAKNLDAIMLLQDFIEFE
ncbi:MAG: type II toxin-antitoxin system VapC family toxin [Methylococcaceae bacterium]|jgi:predicted nucleic acid-binding protein